jgi:hypothetical protein
MTEIPAQDLHGASTADSHAIHQGVQDHLRWALEAENPAIKNYHIRSAQQLLISREYK